MLNASKELLRLLSNGARGEAQSQGVRVRELILELERSSPADLATPGALELLEGVWELRWSSSSQPYLQAVPWLENLQILSPSRERALNLLRPPGGLAVLGGIAIEASIKLEHRTCNLGSTPQQRVQVQFQRGGWSGPQLGSTRLQLQRDVRQSFPAWLDITVLSQELRLCHGNAGTIFGLLRRPDLAVEAFLDS
ncbi:MAG: PAP fibrillin [Cyanobacteria bacterium]|nr:PAP fibrillin [Cyanobacteriota bacterium]